MSRLREFMFDRVYMGEDARREHARIETVLRALFEHYVAICCWGWTVRRWPRRSTGSPG